MADAQTLPQWKAPLGSSAITRKPVAPPIANGLPVEKTTIDRHTTVIDRFNRFCPSQKMYLGRSRRTFLLILGGIGVLLIFVLGLGLGLGLKPSSHINLPLPSSGGIFTGDLTYYAPALGACGFVSSSSDSICAVSHILFDAMSEGSNPNDNPLCGMKITVERFIPSKRENRSVDLEVVDRCVGCKAVDLDLSLSAFTNLAREAEGRVTGSWAWLP